MMTNEFKLTQRAKNWINAIHSKYQSHLVEEQLELPELTGSLTK
jgi:hypothetical protein